MGRQFRFFLLPSDIEALIGGLRSNLNIKLIQETSPTFTPLELASPIQSGQNWFGAFGRRNASWVRCYLAPPSADIKLRYYPTRAEWLVQVESEVIEFSGCEYDGNGLLTIGRMYFQADMLLGDSIWRKRDEFIRWSEKIFRAAKKQMVYSESFRAYFGKDADNWRKNGGRLLDF